MYVLCLACVFLRQCRSFLHDQDFQWVLEYFSDPTNGYTAIHRSVLARIDLKNVSERYFFESDMLVKLGAERAVVIDIPMEAIYADEESNLRVAKILPEFFQKTLF